MTTTKAPASAADNSAERNKERQLQLADINQSMKALSADDRVLWSLENISEQTMLSSSFGIQSAVMLHLLTRHKPDIPVVLTDTGYLFPETYQFIDQLTERLNLNLKVFKAEKSAAWQEASYGKLWEKGAEGIKQYNTMNKVEPMKRALQELNSKTWFSGIRQGQSSTRAERPIVEHSFIRGEEDPVFKIHPILEWSNRDIYQYLKKYDLPYHPLWEEGYVSVGDVQMTQKLEPGMTEEQTRFFGLARECGLHEYNQGSGI